MCARRTPEQTFLDKKQTYSWRVSRKVVVRCNHIRKYADCLVQNKNNQGRSSSHRPGYRKHTPCVVDKPCWKWSTPVFTLLKKKGKRVIIPWKKKVGVLYMHPEIKIYKSNWLVVSAWSYHTKVPGSNPTTFRKNYMFFFLFSVRWSTVRFPWIHKKIFRSNQPQLLYIQDKLHFSQAKTLDG